MKRITLITILALVVLFSYGYAEDAQPIKDSKEMHTDRAAVESFTDAPSMAAASGGTPDASAGGGISGSISPFLGESFQVDSATGAATLNIPITVPPGRKNIQPNLFLFYSSNNPNGICGVGWSIPLTYIQRSTKKGLPGYDENDTFIFISSGANVELVYIGNNEYRPKIESNFMKYIFSGNIWTLYDKSGTKYTLGPSGNSRLEDNGNIFAWYLDRIEDVYGNYIIFIYDRPDDGNIYLKEIRYTGNRLNMLEPDKSILFTYIDRQDRLYSYRSVWLIATTRLLKSIEVRLNNERVWLYDLDYITSSDTGRSLLNRITVYDKYGNRLPPKSFTYQRLD